MVATQPPSNCKDFSTLSMLRPNFSRTQRPYWGPLNSGRYCWKVEGFPCQGSARLVPSCLTGFLHSYWLIILLYWVVLLSNLCYRPTFQQQLGRWANQILMVDPGFSSSLGMKQGILGFWSLPTRPTRARNPSVLGIEGDTTRFRVPSAYWEEADCHRSPHACLVILLIQPVDPVAIFDNVFFVRLIHWPLHWWPNVLVAVILRLHRHRPAGHGYRAADLISCFLVNITSHTIFETDDIWLFILHWIRVIDPSPHIPKELRLIQCLLTGWNLQHWSILTPKPFPK